ncbi:hypothetical protein [Enterococcus faecium]|uniref:hypothetical protein n=1 Tax=Enterococcus faecium TaxID=1352 RepID=UPI0006BD1981|nr:hypothetical protein [Enterococcus faecium]ALF50663.1 hypothetical protein AMR85_11840 [Enterococcus faecium]ALL10517.1 hypothetical protein AQ614_08360 [Enterococcus faecium]MBW4159283.1 hypothetical protein [Enterococcus faecium]MDG4623824.1 hypothetical protein [Enterococcus faecium]MDP4513058.1 hypothetical protein [Enterococcus faecium]
MRNQNNKNKIEYYYTNNRYFDYFINTETYKDIYKSKEAILSLILALITTVMINMLISSLPTSETSEKIIDLLTLSIGSMVGLLGFIIGGLALIVGSIGKKMMNVINSSGNFKELLGIIFRFYFIGSILGISIVINIFTYLIVLFPYCFNQWLSIVLVVINSYAFFFSLISSIMLMGSCIRLMTLQYAIEESQKDE